MSAEARDIIADALKAQNGFETRDGSFYFGSAGTVSPDAILAALAAAGWELVRLPEPEEREDDAEIATAWDTTTSYQVTVWDGHSNEVQVAYDYEPSEPLNGNETRAFAAALLAAARQAEQ